MSLLSLAHRCLVCPCISAPGGNRHGEAAAEGGCVRGASRGFRSHHGGPEPWCWQRTRPGQCSQREEGSSHGKGSAGLYTAESETTRMCLVTGSASPPGPRALSTSVSCPRGSPARSCPAAPRVDGARSSEGTAGGRVSAGPKGHRRRAHPSADRKAAVHLPALGVKVEAQKDPETGDGGSRAC